MLLFSEILFRLGTPPRKTIPQFWKRSDYRLGGLDQVPLQRRLHAYLYYGCGFDAEISSMEADPYERRAGEEID